MFLRNGRVGIMDLSSGESSETELTEELGAMSALQASDVLRKEHGDSLVLGTGVLTGSLVPAACAGLVSSSRGTMPVLGSAGVELKLAGFDFFVVKGEAPSPGYIWIRDGIAEFVSYPSMSSMDSWARIERIRADQGDKRIQVLAAGPWGDALREGSCLTVGHWAGEDDVSTAPEFGRRKLLAVAFRGMGELEVSDAAGHMSASVDLRKSLASKLGGSEGLASYWDGAKDSGFKALLHRNVGCYGCPHPCRSFLKINEDPGHMALSATEPGYLHFDIPSLDSAVAAGMAFKDATAAFMECAKAGADPSSVVGPGVSSIEAVRKALASGASSHRDRRSAPGSFRNLAKFEECVGLGLCPRYWAKAGFDMDRLSACVEPALGRALR